MEAVEHQVDMEVVGQEVAAQEEVLAEVAGLEGEVQEEAEEVVAAEEEVEGNVIKSATMRNSN
jgi:hypothetical protein